MFSLDKFLESDEERRAPKARIYIPALLNWIQFDQAMQIRTDAADLWSRIYTSTRYGNAVIERGFEPHFNQPDLYKHHFLCMYRHLRELGSVDARTRFGVIRDQIRAAMAYYQEIEEMPLYLDTHGSGAHLQPWLDALSRYYRKFVK